MRILFDQGTPVPLRTYLSPHTVAIAFELGWANLKNGELLAAAETMFDLFITTDQQLRYQQNLDGGKLAILVLLTANWPRLRICIPEIQIAVENIKPGDYLELSVK